MGALWLASQSLAPGQRRTDSFRRWVETHEDALFLPAASIVEAGPLTEVAHRGGAKVLHTIASGDAARRAVDDGADIIVAQGWEAGGHVHGKVATMALVPTVVDRVSGTPVIAAGGIADGRGLAAAMALGASGAWIGTRFPASPDAAIHSRYRNLLLAAKETDTEYGALFDVQWPDAPHRALGNATFDEWQKAGRPVRGKRPGEGDIVAKSPEAGKLAKSLGRKVDEIDFAAVTGLAEVLASSAFMFSNLWLNDALRRSLNATLPQIENTDGGPLEFITVHFPLISKAKLQAIRIRTDGSISSSPRANGLGTPARRSGRARAM